MNFEPNQYPDDTVQMTNRLFFEDSQSVDHLAMVGHGFPAIAFCAQYITHHATNNGLRLCSFIYDPSIHAYLEFGMNANIPKNLALMCSTLTAYTKNSKAITSNLLSMPRTSEGCSLLTPISLPVTSE